VELPCSFVGHPDDRCLEKSQRRSFNTMVIGALVNKRMTTGSSPLF